jgi:hypothetical protein
MKTKLNDDQRLTVPAGIFGHHFGTRIEPDVFAMASRLSPDYNGGYWEFYRTEQGAFFMAPSADRAYLVCSNNGYMSAEAFGITACLYVYSHATFTQVGKLLDSCADQFHLLRDYAKGHPEAMAIFQAID